MIFVNLNEKQMLCCVVLIVLSRGKLLVLGQFWLPAFFMSNQISHRMVSNCFAHVGSEDCWECTTHGHVTGATPMATPYCAMLRSFGQVHRSKSQKIKVLQSG